MAVVPRRPLSCPAPWANLGVQGLDRRPSHVGGSRDILSLAGGRESWVLGGPELSQAPHPTLLTHRCPPRPLCWGLHATVCPSMVRAQTWLPAGPPRTRPCSVLGFRARSSPHPSPRALPAQDPMGLGAPVPGPRTRGAHEPASTAGFLGCLPIPLLLPGEQGGEKGWEGAAWR